MKRLIPLFFLLFLFSQCTKKESDLIWERSFNKGDAINLMATPDSGFAACGFTGDNPYFVRFDKSRALSLELKSGVNGLFSSFWFDTSGYVMAGNSSGKMLLMRHSASGRVLWEKTIDAGYRIDITTVFYTGGGRLLAIGSASPDTSYSGATGILFVTFDTTGQVITQKNNPETRFIASGNAVRDASGNIYLPLTRMNIGAKSRATIAKYNDQFFKLWETELYNNPDFGASSKSVIINSQGTVFVTGHTELTSPGGAINNSFLVSLSGTGAVNWKKYLESSNTGKDLLIDDDGDIMILNKNCCIIRYSDSSSGAETGTLRLFSECNSKTTSAYGSAMDLFYDKNILVAGSRSENFSVSLKSSK